MYDFVFFARVSTTVFLMLLFFFHVLSVGCSGQVVSNSETDGLERPVSEMT